VPRTPSISSTRSVRNRSSGLTNFNSSTRFAALYCVVNSAVGVVGSPRSTVSDSRYATRIFPFSVETLMSREN
jgi:hypothetical protein